MLNEQQYYEAHDVIEQLWLNTNTNDDHFSKDSSRPRALSFISKHFEHPTRET
jgi:hypothetical protein